MKQHEMIVVKVTGVRQETPLIRHFTLAAADGRPLPAFTGGSHVIVQMRQSDAVWRNAYSLMGPPADTSAYQIAVRREEASRGGSAFMHERVEVGTTLEISPPNNLFALAPDGRRHVLIAGGIGITPFLSQLYELADGRADYALHYAFRSPTHAAFAKQLLAGPHRERVHLYDDSEGNMLDVPQLVASLDVDAHVYVCGPGPLIDAVERAFEARGLPRAQFHREQFGARPAQGGSFRVRLARTGQEIEVAEGVSMLEAIERQTPVQVPCLCREGVCGTCETRILEGEAEHCDQYLSDAEKAAQRTVMLCVSRSRSPLLVLDL